MIHMQNFLNITLWYQFGDMVVLLGESRLCSGRDLVHKESLLYVAAETGRDDYLKILLQMANDKHR